MLHPATIPSAMRLASSSRRALVMACFAALALLVSCRREARPIAEPPQSVDPKRIVSADSLHNNMLLITRSCEDATFLGAAQKVIVRENPVPGVVFVLDPADPQNYNAANGQSLVTLLNQQTSISLESGPQQACVQQFADHLGKLVSAAETRNSG